MTNSYTIRQARLRSAPPRSARGSTTPLWAAVCGRQGAQYRLWRFELLRLRVPEQGDLSIHPLLGRGLLRTVGGVLHSLLAWPTVARQLFARFDGAGSCIGGGIWSRLGRRICEPVNALLILNCQSRNTSVGDHIGDQPRHHESPDSFVRITGCCKQPFSARRSCIPNAIGGAATASGHLGNIPK
jgi:hypothetical protein